MRVREVLRKEILHLAQEYDKALLKLSYTQPDGDVFRLREFDRFRRFYPTPSSRKGSWLPSASPPSPGTCHSSLFALLQEAFPEQPHFALNPSDSTSFNHSLDSELERGFSTLRRLQRQLALAGQIEEEGENFKGFTKDPRILFDAGDIFRHRKYDYRGVVVQWFRRCPAGQDWLDKWGPFENGSEQPFYRTLIHVGDRDGALSTLAAEENLVFLENMQGGIEHPKVEDFFQGYECGHHVLREEFHLLFREDW